MSFSSNVRKYCFEICWAIQGVIVPRLKYSQQVYEEILRSHVNPDKKWLDLGCGHKLLPPWRFTQEKELIGQCKMMVGIDYDFHSLKNHKNLSLKIEGDIVRLPFKDNSFHLITANMVMEHLDNPELQLREVNRTLKPGGMFILHTPNALGYTAMAAKCVPSVFKKRLLHFLEGRKEQDTFDIYYKFNTKARIIRLAKRGGFQLLNIKMIVSSPRLVMIPPLVIVELIWIRILMTRAFRPLRTNIIGILKKIN